MEDKKIGKIRREAKEIIDSFSQELEKVKEKVKKTQVERKEDRREEGEGFLGSEDFRKIILDNAPGTQDGFIKSEKGKWTK